MVISVVFNKSDIRYSPLRRAKKGSQPELADPLLLGRHFYGHVAQEALLNRQNRVRTVKKKALQHGRPAFLVETHGENEQVLFMTGGGSLGGLKATTAFRGVRFGFLSPG